MHWYLVYTKPRQEKYAVEHLERQGYECYLPFLYAEKVRQGCLTVTDEPLFPRYLFVRLSQDASSRSWSPIRSTKGVSRLVSFGLEPAKVRDDLVDLLKSQASQGLREPKPLFKAGEPVRLVSGPFSGLDGIYQMAEGERRVMVLIEFLSKQVPLKVSPSNVSKVG